MSSRRESLVHKIVHDNPLKFLNPVVMLDPSGEALAEGLEIARKKKIADRLFAVVGFAEKMPFPDNTVDLVVSRGSIFFWEDPVKGLKEVDRVLRPGGKAFIGGGLIHCKRRMRSSELS